jgi:ankyrin repeat protein
VSGIGIVSIIRSDTKQSRTATICAHPGAYAPTVQLQSRSLQETFDSRQRLSSSHTYITSCSLWHAKPDGQWSPKLDGSPNDSLCDPLDVSPPKDARGERHLGRVENNPHAFSRFQGRSCLKGCKCPCHTRHSWHLLLLDGRLGSLIVTSTGDPFNPQECTKNSCRHRSTPKTLAVYYAPRWLPTFAVLLDFSNGERPHIGLSFPRIMPPDSELFIYIRTGQCDLIKQLLCNGKASVADIAAPYGITPLTLAIIYDQQEVCNLLIRLGANRFAPNYTWSTNDVWEFILGFSPLKSSLSAGAMLQDYVRLCSAEPKMTAQRNQISDHGGESDSFMRLKNSVLGLSSECVESVGRLSRQSINETDSFGQTCLHLAVYTAKSEVISGLLSCGADPNLRDCNGITPLHTAAALGSAKCVDTLLAAGANFHSQDRFGATPIHHASSQGHPTVMDILMGAGASCEAVNFYGETAISYAIYGRRTGVLKTFSERGAKLDCMDKWGYTPVLDAVFVDSHEVLDLLLSAGMTTTSKLVDDKTILHIAALTSDLRTIEILQNAHLGDLDTEAVDTAGYTALDYLLLRLRPFLILWNLSYWSHDIPFMHVKHLVLNIKENNYLNLTSGASLEYPEK